MTAFGAELARWALVLVFAAAVVGKLVWPDALTGLAMTLRAGLRVPRRLAGPAALALVVAEAAVAVTVAIPATAATGLLAAAVLGAAMTAGAAVLARRADALPCRCFGANSAAVTWWTVLRNAALTASAGGALASPGVARVAPLTSLVACATAAVLLLAVRAIVLHAPRRTHRHDPAGPPVTLPPNGPELGTPAPAVPGVLPPRDGGVRLVAFASAGCRGCRDGLPRLVAYARLAGGRDRVVVAIVGDAAAGADIEAAVAGVARVVGGERADGLAAVYGIVVFPTYVLVADGLVEAVSPSIDELPRLVR